MKIFEMFKRSVDKNKNNIAHSIRYLTLSEELSESEIGLFAATERFINVAYDESQVEAGKYNRNYHDGLPLLLARQHEVFEKIITFLMLRAKHKQFNQVNSALAIFKEYLQLHYSIESVQIYKYIESISGELKVTSETATERKKYRDYELKAKQFKAETRSVTTMMREFYNRYYMNGKKIFSVSESDADKFIEDLQDNVKTILLSRMLVERKALYPIYNELSPNKLSSPNDQLDELLEAEQFDTLVDDVGFELKEVTN